MQRLVTELFGRWDGKPALVIGGGPSVLRDLGKLAVLPELVISANEHGCHQSAFKVDLITNVDKIHCLAKEPMEKLLRPYGIPIVNRHSWADYRLPDWTLCGNTGMQAIALAALLGANPVLVTGIDMTGQHYFHDKGAKPPKGDNVKRAGAARRRQREAIKPMQAFVKGANIRPLSGPLTAFFPQYDKAEVVKPARKVPFRERLERETTAKIVEVVKSFRLSNGDYTKVGQRLAVSQFELAKMAGEVRVLTEGVSLV